MRQYCKIANSAEGMEKLMEHTLQRQVQALATQNEVLQEQVGRLAGIVEKQLIASENPRNPLTINAVTQINARTDIQVNIVGFDRSDRIRVPVSALKAAFTENPRLVEYCGMSDEERTDAEKAAPYVLEALVDLVRRAHHDPVYRNVFLSRNRADQVMVCVEESAEERADRGRSWEIRPLVEATRLLFDGVSGGIHRIIITDQDRAQLPFDVQGAAAWVPSLYGYEPERFAQLGRAPMAAHLANTRPADVAG